MNNEQLRRIDALVAEHVMGLTLRDEFQRDRQEVVFGGEHLDLGMGWYCCVVPRYTIDIAAAWKLVEHFGGAATIYGPGGSYAGGEYAASSWGCEISGDFPSEYDPECRTDYVRCYEAESAPLAICLAALKAVGVDIPE